MPFRKINALRTVGAIAAGVVVGTLALSAIKPTLEFVRLQMVSFETGLPTEQIELLRRVAGGPDEIDRALVYSARHKDEIAAERQATADASVAEERAKADAAAAEEKRAAAPHHDPGAIPLCPSGRMTRDGCQR
jgi:hypothetical protein